MGSMNRRKESAIMGMIAEQIATDAETLERLLAAIVASGRTISREEYEIYQTMQANIVNRVIFDLASIRARVALDSEIKRNVATGERNKPLTKSHMIAAINAYVATGGFLTKGWKAGVLDHLRQLYPQHHRYRRWDQIAHKLPISEEELKELLPDWKSTKRPSSR